MKKWGILTGYALLAGLIVWYRDEIWTWMQADTVGWQYESAVFLAAFAIAFVPAIPYALLAGLFGVKYGPVLGSAVNVGISMLAAILLFLLVRFAFSPDQRAKAANMKGFVKLTAIAEQSPFLAVLFARLLPFTPAQAVNIFAALTRMAIGPYIAASLLGKIPFLVAATILGNRVFDSFDWQSILLIVAIYCVFLLLVYAGFRTIRSRTRKDERKPPA